VEVIIGKKSISPNLLPISIFLEQQRLDGSISTHLWHCIQK